MRKERFILSFLIIVILTVGVSVLSLIFTRFINFAKAQKIQTSIQTITTTSNVKVAKVESLIVYNPPNPEDAPTDIRDAVMLGYNIMMESQKYAGKYVGDKLRCSSCHFNGGITQGGKNGGISLVGVATKYPKYTQREKADLNLPMRINDCFERSMNGKPLPLDSKEMLALLTYYQWISKGLPIYEDILWLGLKHLQSDHKQDPQKGKLIFTQNCAMCHGNDGQGTQISPPLWGKDSFNDGAGMSKLEKLAAFVYLNMPLGSPNLTIDEALDVASFVISEPRSHFVGK
jgi:thiosulfate dehydrogenase